MFNFNGNEWAAVVYNIVLLGALISSFFIRTTTDRGNKLKQLAVWFLIIFMGVVFYNNKHMFRNFIPYMATDIGENRLMIKKSSDNHFYITLKVNGKNVLFLIDTGATTTSLTQSDAKRIGIDIKSLKYNQLVNTANGSTFSASFELKDISVENYKIDSLWVLINKNMDGQSLLGMNFLNKLKGYDIREDTMTLYY